MALKAVKLLLRINILTFAFSPRCEIRPQEGCPQEGCSQEGCQEGRPQEGCPQEGCQDGRPQEGRQEDWQEVKSKSFL